MPKYIHFSEAQKQAAKSVDLAEFLQSRGEAVKRSGSEHEWVGRHVTLRGSAYFDHYAQRGGGSVDFTRRYLGLGYAEAMQLLLDGAGVPICAPPPRLRQPFALPPPHDNIRRVYAYLIKQRGIDCAVLADFARRGLVYEDAKYHNVVFVGVDADGQPRHAHKKSTSLRDSSFRANQTGSEAAFSFHHIGVSDRIYAFEAPIDMLSFITLYPKNWRCDSYVALCSVADRALFHQLEQHPHLRSVALCLDNDDAGQTAAAQTAAKLRERGYNDVDIVTPKLKDFNEDLVARGGEPAWGTMSLC